MTLPELPSVAILALLAAAHVVVAHSPVGSNPSTSACPAGVSAAARLGVIAGPVRLVRPGYEPDPVQLFASQYQASGRPALASLPAFPSNDLITISDRPDALGHSLHLVSQPGRFNASILLRDDVRHAVNLPRMGVGDRDAILASCTDGQARLLRFDPATHGHTAIAATAAGYGELANWGAMAAYWLDASGNLLGHDGTSVRRVAMDTSHEPGASGAAFQQALGNTLPQVGAGSMPGIIVHASAMEWSAAPGHEGDEIALLVDNQGDRRAYIARANSGGGSLIKLAELWVGNTDTRSCMVVSRGTPVAMGDPLVDCLAIAAGWNYGGGVLTYCVTWCNPSSGAVANVLPTPSRVLALASHDAPASGDEGHNDLLLALEKDARVLALQRTPTSFALDAQGNYHELADGYQPHLLAGGDMDGDGDADALVGITGGTRHATILMHGRIVRQQFRATLADGSAIAVSDHWNGSSYKRVTMRLDRNLPIGVGSGNDLADAASRIQVELFTHRRLTGSNVATQPSDSERLASSIVNLTAGQDFFDVALTYPGTGHPANDLYYVCMRYLDGSNLPVGPALMALHVPESREAEFAGPIAQHWPELNVDDDPLDGGGVDVGGVTPITKKRPPPVRQTPKPVTHSEQKAPGT